MADPDISVTIARSAVKDMSASAPQAADKIGKTLMSDVADGEEGAIDRILDDDATQAGNMNETAAKLERPAGGGASEATSSAMRRKLTTIFGSGGGEDSAASRITATGADDPLKADSPDAAAAYERIRGRPDDTARIAENTGYDQSLLDRVKSHVFVAEHDVEVGPGETVRGRFAPQDEAGRLWEKATKGPLSGDEADLFRGWLAHEGVESSLMRDGMPYRSADPSAWVRPFDDDDDLMNKPNPEHFGAHDLSPNAWDYKRPFKQWSLLGLPKPEISIAPDLSNLDDVVGLIRGSIG